MAPNANAEATMTGNEKYPSVTPDTFAIDLHVHSRHSTRPSQWVLQRMGCPESFTKPRRIYDIARARGMGLVTITDHNTITGSLEIAHLPGAFVSEEITTYFPEDRCKLHVLAYNITEAHHAEFQRLRENVFELVPYLRAEGIVHVLAHPLFAVNGKLTPEHFEQALLLFNTLELNGSRDAFQNSALRQIAAALTPEVLERLADKHGIDPFGGAPWIKALVAGSDDHSSLGIARMHTRFSGPATVSHLLAAIPAGQGRIEGEPASPWNMAHNLCGIAFQFYKSRSGRLPESHLCVRFADALLDPAAPRKRNLRSSLRTISDRARLGLYALVADKNATSSMLLAEASQVIRADANMMDAARGRDTGAAPEDTWRRFVSRVSDRLLARFAGRTLAAVQSADIFGLFHEVASAGSLYAMLSPFFLACELFASERAFARQCLDRFGLTAPRARKSELKIAHFTDTFAEVNGVARTIQQQIELAGKHGKDMTVVTCTGGLERDDISKGAARFAPVGSFSMPEYPEITLHYPPFLKLLAWCAEQDFDCILTATPGPMGLAGLAIARILKIPVHGTYHTAFPQYVRMFTEDPAMEDAAWRYMRWFYGQMDTIYAPSRSTAQDLAERGIKAERIVVHPRGVDAERFHPDNEGRFFADMGLARQVQDTLCGPRLAREEPGRFGRSLPPGPQTQAGRAARHRGRRPVPGGDARPDGGPARGLHRLPAGRGAHQRLRRGGSLRVPQRHGHLRQRGAGGPGQRPARGGDERRRPARGHAARPHRSGGGAVRPASPGHERPRPDAGPRAPGEHGRAGAQVRGANILRPGLPQNLGHLRGHRARAQRGREVRPVLPGHDRTERARPRQRRRHRREQQPARPGQGRITRKDGPARSGVNQTKAPASSSAGRGGLFVRGEPWLTWTRSWNPRTRRA